MPTISAGPLTEFATRLFQAGGVPAGHAETVAKSLVESNLRGHDSHGVMRVPSYIHRIQDGSIDPKATLKIESEAAGTLVGDGQWGLGQVVTQDLMRRLISKGREAGIACATLKRAAHIGRLGEYAEMAAKEGLLTIICANTHGAGQRVAPVGGKRPRIGTNPICMGVPGGGNGPFVLDFGTSATAEGKVRVKKIAGEKVPLGWILDPDGNPSTDPNVLYGNPPGTILPMGGDQAYKGFGLAFMIEMLCGGLSGGPCAHPNPPTPFANCAVFIVLDPEKFAGAGHLAKEIGGLEEYVRGVPLIDEKSKVTLPGDPERLTLQKRSTEGIPLDDGNWQALLKLSTELKVEPVNA